VRVVVKKSKANPFAGSGQVRRRLRRSLSLQLHSGQALSVVEWAVAGPASLKLRSDKFLIGLLIRLQWISEFFWGRQTLYIEHTYYHKVMVEKVF
jgi:hypothetical protein